MAEKCKICKRQTMFNIFQSDVPICVYCMRKSVEKAFNEFNKKKMQNNSEYKK